MTATPNSTSNSTSTEADAPTRNKLEEISTRGPGKRSEHLSSEEQVQLAVQGAEDRKALDIKVLDLSKIADFTDLFVIASATNERQAKAIADAVDERLRPQGIKPLHVEGYQAASWVLMDYGGDMLVHIFQQDARGFYDLERLWADAPDMTAKYVTADPAAPKDANGEASTSVD